jgi:hypothetical protein
MDPRLEILVKDNRSSLFAFVIGAEKKVFITFTPGGNVIKLFCPLFTDFRNKLECLSLGSFPA